MLKAWSTYSLYILAMIAEDVYDYFPKMILAIFWHGLFLPSVMRGGGGDEGPPHHNFVVIVLMIMKFGTGIELDVFYTMATKKFVTSLILRNYDLITCILADA